MAPVGCFRCDATGQIGFGHFIRCAALAEELIRRGWSCRFIMGPGTSSAARSLVPKVIEIIEAEDADNSGAVRELLPPDCNLLVIDSYRLGMDFERGLQGAAQQLMVIDDLPSRPHHCDLFLDQTHGRRREAYSPLLPPDAGRLVGSAYALLRPSFAAERHRAVSRRQRGSKMQRLLVAMGGAPNPAVMEQIAAGIAKSGHEVEVHVVGGADIAASGGMRVIRHPQTPAMHDIMSSCDLAIGAGGTSAWERCCLGLPSIIVQVADNQADVAATLAAAGAAIDVGPVGPGTSKLIAAALSTLGSDAAALLAMANRAALVCDGLGARRVASVIAPQRASDGRPVTLRPATFEDARLVFEWQQIPQVRQFANDPRAPTWENHLRWIVGRLSNPLAGPFSIIQYGDRPAGVLRLDYPLPDRLRTSTQGNDAHLVSILIDPELHRLKIAQAALVEGRALLPDARFYAEVHSDNAASHRLFQTAGFVLERPGLYVS